jgi:hypothetical protein
VKLNVRVLLMLCVLVIFGLLYAGDKLSPKDEADKPTLAPVPKSIGSITVRGQQIVTDRQPMRSQRS